MTTTEQISQTVQNGQADEVVRLIEMALNEGIEIQTILNQGLIQGMAIIGKKFKEGEIFIPEVLIAARAMTKGIGRLEPLLIQGGIEPRGTILLGTVKDDLHDIGKNLVAVMFKGAGFRVIDLGVNVPKEKFVAAAREYRPDVIGLSALLTTTMINMEGIIRALRENDVTIPVIIGGAPVTAEYARSIQADLFARSAVEGVDLVLNHLGAA